MMLGIKVARQLPDALLPSLMLCNTVRHMLLEGDKVPQETHEEQRTLTRPRLARVGHSLHDTACCRWQFNALVAAFDRSTSSIIPQCHITRGPTCLC